MAEKIKRVLVAGGGTAGWMTAAALSKTLAGGVEIQLVESRAIGTIGVGEATIPTIRTFNATLQIDEREFVRATQGTFKLGIEFTDWGKVGESYFHPFGTHGRAPDIVPVHQYWLKARAEGDVMPFDQFSVAWHLAKSNRFTRPVPDPREILSTHTYAYHFDAGLYAKFLRAYSEARGVQRIEGKIETVELRPENGHVAALKLEDGRRLEADLFIDCTGFRGLLIEEALGEPFVDWGAWLPCDSAVTVGSEALSSLPPYTRSNAHSAGWQWRIPLQHRTGNGHVFSRNFMTAEIAEQTLRDNLPTAMMGEPRHLKFRTGVRRRQWVKNVVSVGLASGFMEPLESTSIHLIQANISKLIAYFPDLEFDPLGVEEFNRVAQIECERIRDFLILHYKLNARHGEPMWDYCRDMEVPETLALRIEHFKRFGRVVPRDLDIFATDSWLAVHIGQNNIPDSLDPLLKARGNDASDWLRKLHNGLKAQTAAQQSHAQFIATHCAAEPV